MRFDPREWEKHLQMLCDECKEREATVHTQLVVGSQKKDIHLCGRCAMEKGFSQDTSGVVDLNALVNGLAGDMLGMEIDLPESREADSVRLRCPGCGLTDLDFSTEKRFGCARCYDVFTEMLDPVLSQFHRGASHTGKIPGDGGGLERDTFRSDLAILKCELSRAVIAEEYERAAELRDEIRDYAELEKGAG